jgi:signal transduction histidine kinase
MKLFPKLALTVSSLVLLSTVGLSLSFYWIEDHSIRQQAEQERRAVLGNLTHMAEESFLTDDDLLLIKYAGWIPTWNPSIVSASVVDAHGIVLADSEPRRIGKRITAADAAAIPPDVLVLSAPIHLGSQGTATAAIGFSQRLLNQALQAQLRVLQKRVLWIGGSALALSLLIAFVLALSWTRPIRILTQAAAQVGQANYRIDLKQLESRRDELGAFSRIFHSMAEQLKQLDQMKEDFVSAVTHELRSPLGAIESYLNVIDEELREGVSREDWRTYLERLRINTQRLTRFVNDLLDVAALERGKVALDCQAVSLGLLIQDVLALFSAKMGERKLSVRTDIAADAPPAWADGDKIRQVLTNLLSNAIKFTPSGGIIEVGLRSAKPSTHIEVYVQDSGVGISAENQGRIFNKFEQVHAARQTLKGPKGTGLGLSICKALVELHGGAIGVKSQAGSGSRFFFTLPAAMPEPGRAAKEKIIGELV